MMTPPETQALQDFLTQLTQVRGITKDPQASSMIDAAMAQQPDAGYLLVQRSMLQEQALNTARAQIAQLQAQLQAEREAGNSAGGNAGSGAGFLDQANTWGNSAYDNRRAAVAPAARYENAAPPQYANPQPGQYQAPPQAAQRPGFFGGGGLGGGSGSGFLGNMAATAAGVAGGAFLFQGIENLMGHHGGGMGSGFLGQNNGGLPVESTTVNNFYGSDADDRGSDRADTDRASLADDSIDDAQVNDDYGSNDDLGSADDMSSI